ncbi:spheroidene monooxygenase [Streptosporangium sp. DT93]|uniref:spheroidene monooxygenase n=1 Tax=Streptosporangium sp. DT93 TaxID=3393428 RepID=UPI003CED1E1D
MRYMAYDRPVLRRTPGLVFWRLLGSGRGSSTSLAADLRRWALFAVWRQESDLDRFLATSPISARWRGETAESWHVRLAPLASRGRWDGVEPFGSLPEGGRPVRSSTEHGTGEAEPFGSLPGGGRPAGPAGDRGPGGMPDPAGTRAGTGMPGPGGPVAVLTRASVRPSRLVPFYRSVPEVDRLLAEQDGRLASVGIGEWPLARQGTFSLWRDEAAMRDFAHRGRAHRQVIGRTRAERWYSEDLFARFTPYASEGTWDGADPLA